VHRILSLVFLAILGFAIGEAMGSPEPGSTAAASSEASRIVFLLQYVGADYGSAVVDGKIVDEAEYRENRDFAGEIAQKLPRLQASMPAAAAAAVEEQVRRLLGLIEAHGDPRLVRESAESAIPRLVEAFGLQTFPRERPNPERAQALYGENCAVCHGRAGGGDGPRAKELDPSPARFTDLARMRSAAPYVFYNAITLGVANTAMASFSDSLSDQERWDLAFYLWTFALAQNSTPESLPTLVVSLRDLATRTSVELVPEVTRQAAAGQPVDEQRAERWVAQLRAHPAALSDAQERLARVRQDLAQSVALVRRGDLDQAVELVTTSYLSEFEPLEPELDERDTRVRQSFEHGLVDFRAALRRGDRAGALATAAELEATIDRASTVLEGRGSFPGMRRVELSLLVAVAVAALAFVAHRIGMRS
jgi:high-affinity iron transporter